MGSDRQTSAKAEQQEEKPSDKYARSDQMPPPGKRKTPQFVSDINNEDVVDEAAEDSFPASDPPGYSKTTDEPN